MGLTFVWRRNALALLALVVSTAVCGRDSSSVAGPGETVDTITITPDAATFGAAGSSIQLEALAFDAAGDPVPDAEIVWTTAGSGVVFVEPETGVLTSIGNGSDRVIASVGEISANIPATVEQDPVSLDHDGSVPVLGRIGARAALLPIAVDSNGARVTVPGSFTYSTSNHKVAGVNEFGVVQANDFGVATITVSMGELQTSLDVTVEASGIYEPALDAPIPCAAGRAGPFSCDRVDLVAFLPLVGLGTEAPVEIGNIWGWRDSTTSREYAVIARSDGVAFVDVTEPEHPRTIGFLGASFGSSDVRDVEVYRDHAYVVADDSPGHGVQIFDLTRLRGIDTYTEFTEDDRYIDIGMARNIAVNAEAGFAFVVGATGSGIPCGGGLHILDLSNPAQPAFAGCFDGTGFIHDVRCIVYTGPDAQYAGREVCVGSNLGAIAIIDVTDKAGPVALSVVSHPGTSASQGWLTPDQRFYIQNDFHDEIQASETIAIPTRTWIWDVSDLDAPTLALTYEGPDITADHYGHVLGTRYFLSNGTSGLRIVDLSDPTRPMGIGSFDTYPSSDLPSTEGAWSNYPFFEDGRILVTSRREGLFILEPAQ